MGRDAADLDIRFVKGVGPRRAALLSRLGIKTVKDALFYFPARYEDRRSTGKLRDMAPGSLGSVVGRVVSSRVVDLGGAGGGGLFRGSPRRRGGLKLFELFVSDGTGSVRAKWFNQPYMKNRFSPGQQVCLSATLKATPRGLEMENPDYELLGGEGGDDQVHTACIAPVYRTTEGLSARQLRSIMSDVLGAYLGEVVDPMPPRVLEKYGLPGLAEGIGKSHFPDSEADIDALNAWGTPHQRRVAFDELFMLEAGLAALRRQRGREEGISFKSDRRLVSGLLASLPFELTGDQRRVFFDEILADMESPHRMNRLLQGDVGSGKTVVSLMAMLSAVGCGYQAAVMAPTEILAGQHFLNIKAMTEGLGVRTCLLAGGVRERPLEEIARGGIDIVVGTHALIQEGVRFRRLGLAVIDEQHRFGVMQRAELRKKAPRTDVLIMTATPIPRTLALTLYGDLDYSVIRELPPGRQHVKTELYSPDRKKEIYAAIEAEVSDAGQVYVVYPVVEGSEGTPLRSAVLGGEALGRVFPERRVALVHGRMRPAEKDAAMEGFKRGDIDILVSTTVVEVGVDVPNASMMVIVHAERFGLSQLHQLRGRVGRGRRRSRCLLLAYPPLGEEARRRLAVMCRTGDGFEIAEEDLAIRGPGDFLGTRQSGLPDMRVADIARDARLLVSARNEAFGLLEKDPALEGHPALRAEVERFWLGRAELFGTG